MRLTQASNRRSSSADASFFARGRSASVVRASNSSAGSGMVCLINIDRCCHTLQQHLLIPHKFQSLRRARAAEQQELQIKLPRQAAPELFGYPSRLPAEHMTDPPAAA